MNNEQNAKMMEVAKKNYLQLLKNTIASTENIDDDTPWQETEPAWWLGMMELQKLAVALLNKG